MKKRLSILAVLVMSVIVTAYSVSGTYAKYTATAGITDKARVAQFYVNNGLQQTSIFKNAYELGTDNVIVKGKGDAKVIAPGTGNEVEFQIAGTVETKYTLSSEIQLINATKGLASYLPLEFSLYEKTDETTWTKVIEETTFADFKDDFNNLIGKDSDGDAIVYEPGDIESKIYKIAWSWPFEVLDGENKPTTDTEDTALGNNELANLGEIELAIGFTATQVTGGIK